MNVDRQWRRRDPGWDRWVVMESHPHGERETAIRAMVSFASARAEGGTCE
jgi:hypothetical protein